MQIYMSLNKIFNLNLIFHLRQYQCLMIVMGICFYKAFDILGAQHMLGFISASWN